MKGNTIAVALGALLVGGVATAGYMNSRDGQARVQPVGVAASTAALIGEPRQDDGAIPDAGRLAYADVVAVEPVVEHEPRYATVIGVEPIRVSSTTSTPREVCDDVVVQERMPERDGNVGGTVAGALIGGLVCNQVGGGTGKALAFGLSPFAATLLGIMSGIGGGIARDLLVARTPVVLQQTELYAAAALVGSGIVAIAHAFGWPQAPAMAAGALLCFGLRYGAIRRGWRLPVAKSPE